MLETALCLSILAMCPQGTPGPSGPQKAAQSETPKLVAARIGSIRATLERKGRLTPTESAPVTVEFGAFQGGLKVVDCSAHGSMVNTGDVIARFDTEKIDEQIEKSAFDLTQAEAKCKNTEAQQQIAEAAARDALTRAERDVEWARRKLQGYLDHEVGFTKEQDRLSKQSSEHRLDDQKDELTQLEKMYKEDELVDATEEIVLKRSRRSFAQAQAYVKLQRQRAEYNLDYTKAMERERLELDTKMKIKAFDRTKRSQDLERINRTLTLERAKFDLQKKRDAMDKLRRDRERFTVRAPRAGILLHGKVDNAPGAGKLEKGSTAAAGAVLMTVVDPDHFEVRTTIPETHLYRARTGTASTISVGAAPDKKLTGALRVDMLPSSREGDANLYRAVVPVSAQDPRFRPGMGSTVTVSETVKDAVLVPMTAVTDKSGKKTVRCAAKPGSALEDRVVQVGANDGKSIVITSGLTAGELVAVPPEKKK